MKPIFLTVLMLLAGRALAQPTPPIKPIEPPPSTQPPHAAPDLHLEDWNKGVPPPPQLPGVTIYFDYTKFFEWLLPKKHPNIPPECDPDYFLRDTLPEPPAVKQDSVMKQPV